ncbi:MAG TPA: ADP-ribosylglycohydrolase family protein [Blastocatellia bacterium]|nr:ADP-ribosylglycohydrolase family protein [Blastocatellia bacterium]
MKKTLIPLLVLCALPLVTTLIIAQNKTRRLSQAALKVKIKGGWAGQMIGVSFGAPTEFKSNGKIIEGELNRKPTNTPTASGA